MQYLAICEDDLLFNFMRNVDADQADVLFVVENASAAKKIKRHGGKVREGNLLKEETYKKLKLRHVDQAIVFLRDPHKQERVSELVRSLDKNIPILALTTDDDKEPGDSLIRNIPLQEVFEEFCSTALHDTINRKKVERIRSLFEDKEKIHILLQHDPDPDAIGSALALRELLGRNRTTTPIVTFGEVTRPENLAMIHHLDVQIDKIEPGDLHKDGAGLAMVDVQPPYFTQPLGAVDLVVDHHPKRAAFKAHFTDLRTPYGATSTIFTEYLRSIGMEPSQRLATALLYGIKVDTLFLERGSILADLSAFAYLYPLANKALIARIERPAVPREDMEALGRALSRLNVADGVAVIDMGEVKREDVLPQMAEILLQIEGVEWGVVLGLVKDRVVISVRNVGYVKSAGDILKRLYDDIGSAGGHRMMAKAVVPLDRFKQKFGPVNEQAIRDAMLPLILERDQQVAHQ
jgi:nanoRNase/pAp phosphatase (c-di-AMP/oligoRNAs hydrolase)